jgi:hypothetical protein
MIITFVLVGWCCSLFIASHLLIWFKSEVNFPIRSAYIVEDTNNWVSSAYKRGVVLLRHSGRSFM